MNTSTSTKLRAFGGASALALSAGLSTAAVAQATAPDPVQSVPTPAAPAAPGNGEECTLITTATPPEIVCAPGTDADGFQEPFNSISLTVESGSQVQGEISLLVNADVTVDGDIVVTDGNNAIDLGSDATVVNNGFISANPFLDGIITVEERGDITNNGTITSTGNDVVAGLLIGSDTTIVNDGLIALTGNGNAGIVGEVGLGASGVSVTNTQNGQILVETGTGLGIGIGLGDNATIVNDGTIQVFGPNSSGLLLGDFADVTNNGFLITVGDGTVAISVDNGATITNGVNGEFYTSGDNGIAIAAFDDLSVQNDGVITTQGDNAEVISAGQGATIVISETGAMATTGAGSNVLSLGTDAMVTNDGLIQAVGLNSNGLDVTGDGTLINSGRVIANGGTAIAISGAGDITITETGIVSIASDSSTAIDAGDGSTVTSAGLIQSSGTDSGAILVGGNSTVTIEETGIVIANGTLGGGIGSSGAGSTIQVDGSVLVSTSTGGGIGLTDGTVTVGSTGLVRTTGTNSVAIGVFGSTIENAGTVEATNATSTGVFATGGSLDNSGTITGGAAGVLAQDAVITNLAGGVISGATGVDLSGSASGDTLTNLGTIMGSTGNAVTFSGNDDFYVGVNDGMTSGTVDGGAGTDTFAYIISDQTDREFDLGTDIVNFEDIRFGSQSFDFVNGALSMDPATGVVTLTGIGTQAFTVVNTANLAGAQSATVSYIAGASDGITLGFNVTDTGSITTTGDGEIGFDGGDGAVLNNAGSITTTGMNTAAVLLGDDGTVNNTGSIRSEGTSGVAIATGNNAAITNAAGGTITTIGEDGFGIVINGDGTIDNAGIIAVSGDGAQAITVTGEALVLNDGTIAASGGRAIDVALASVIANGETGVIASSGGNAIRMNATASTTSNAGTISTTGDGNTAIDGVAGSTVNNSGTITTDGAGLATVLLGDNSTVNNQGEISSSGDGSVTLALGSGTTLLNVGEGNITSSGDGSPTVVITGDGTITNEATISATGAGSQAITATGDFVLTNSGTISGADGRAIDVAGMADITNETGGTISATGTEAIRFNTASSITNRGTITGTTGVLGSGGDDFVANFGAITGMMNGVSLGLGDDQFQQWTGASVTGNIALEGGDDTFILEGASSSITGSVSGGMGNDTAILAGNLDSDNLVDFETYQLGSQLGGTLSDLDITGNRTLTGDVVHVGVVNVDLGVDSLTTSGSITLEESGILNIATPLDEELLGQTVLVFQDGDGFTNNGATVNILDDDLLIDYTPIVGSLLVRVDAVNPLQGNPDPNLSNISSAVTAGLVQGSLGPGTIDALNALPDAASYADALTDALPSLSDGVGREIFESGSLASQALDRHLRAESSGVWGQIAVRGAEQDALSPTASGYDSDQTVFTVGGDIALGDDVRIGLLASYADIDVQDETATGAITNNQDVESIRLGGYASATLLERGFVNIELSYLTGEVDTSRGGFFGNIASAYDFDGFAARTVFGYDLLADENVSFTPSVGLNAASIDFDDTVESGGFGFAIEQGKAEFIEARFGAELGAQVSEKVNGFIQGVVIHDLIDDERSLRLSSTQLPTFSVVQPLREQDRFELSAGASVDVSENFVIELGYLGDFNSGYSAHSARASVRIGF